MAFYLLGVDRAVWDAREDFAWYGVRIRMDGPTRLLVNEVYNLIFGFYVHFVMEAVNYVPIMRRHPSNYLTYPTREREATLNISIVLNDR